MTIKRRLFFSNILMIIVPVILIIAIVSIMMFAVTDILGIKDHEGDSESFYHSVVQIQEYTKEWSSNNDIEQIKSDLDALSEDFHSEYTSLFICQNEKQQYSIGNYSFNSFLEFILSQKNEAYFTMGKTGIYRTDTGEYTILLVNTNFQSMDALERTEYYQYLINISIFLIIIVIVVILLTNRLLTRMMIKNIITPLDTLVYGVHQIRDGNLSYRIDYSGQDEFAAVCSDFNEMAERLLDMVNARQQDEENRKELIAGISHDLRTPLTSIKTYVEGIELGMASTPQIQKRYLGTIKDKTKDLEHIINQLFLFSKLDIGEFPMQTETIDFGKFLSEFTKDISSEYEQKGLQIDFTDETRNVMVRIDKVQFRNVLINILENSVKYGNKDNGIMRISCHTDHAAAVTFTDNGPGVPKDTLEKLFNLFYRGDKARSNTSQGSGLGLAIAAKIIGLLDGSISAVNASEGGLSITVTLPIIERDEENDKNTNY